MPLSLPPSPTLGQVEPYNGKNWKWMGAYWSAVSQFAPAAEGGPNSFTRAVLLDDYRQTLVTTARTMPLNISATLLEYI